MSLHTMFSRATIFGDDITQGTAERRGVHSLYSGVAYHGGGGGGAGWMAVSVDPGAKMRTTWRWWWWQWRDSSCWRKGLRRRLGGYNVMILAELGYKTLSHEQRMLRRLRFRLQVNIQKLASFWLGVFGCEDERTNERYIFYQ